MSTDDSAAADRGSALNAGLGLVPDATWATVERYADEVHDFNLALKYDVGVDKASAKCLKAEADAHSAILAFAAEQVAAERERLAGGNDLEAMCEAFHRLIEAHANLRSPFHQPVCADAQMALRVLRGIAAGLRA